MSVRRVGVLVDSEQDEVLKCARASARSEGFEVRTEAREQRWGILRGTPLG